MNSALYECTVMHRRLSPVRHEFVYRVFLFALDVDELPTIAAQVPLFGYNESAPYSFFDRDHFQMIPGGSARENAEAYLASQGITEKPARILLLTNARTFGYVFNPISIWYCYRADGSPLAAIAEVGNTFGEIKPYLVPVQGPLFSSRTVKHFYVSPFSTLDQHFDFPLRHAEGHPARRDRQLRRRGAKAHQHPERSSRTTDRRPSGVVHPQVPSHDAPGHYLDPLARAPALAEKGSFRNEGSQPELQRDLYRPHRRS